MRYESKKTGKGNVGVSYFSQEAADAQAAAMDVNGCSDCSDCSDCTRCTRCTRCFHCSDCSDCTRCFHCFHCSDCTGALRWDGDQVSNLLSLNGLRWPVSTDGVSIQIGCQHHTVQEWEAFDDRDIKRMDADALEFWSKYKPMILGLAEARAAQAVIEAVQ